MQNLCMHCRDLFFMEVQLNLRNQMTCDIFIKERKLLWSAEASYIQNGKQNFVFPQLFFLCLYIYNDAMTFLRKWLLKEEISEARRKQCNEAPT